MLSAEQWLMKVAILRFYRLNHADLVYFGALMAHLWRTYGALGIRKSSNFAPSNEM